MEDDAVQNPPRSNGQLRVDVCGASVDDFMAATPCRYQQVRQQLAHDRSEDLALVGIRAANLLHGEEIRLKQERSTGL